MSQTSYSIDIGAVAFEGQLADISKKDVISAIATEDVKYGRAVAISGDYPKHLGALPTADTDFIGGISVADQNRAQDPGVTDPTYKAESALGLVRQGRVYVKLAANSAAAVVGGQVYAVHNVGGGDELGQLSADDDANTVALPGARFLTAAAAGEFAVVELDLA